MDDARSLASASGGVPKGNVRFGVMLLSNQVINSLYQTITGAAVRSLNRIYNKDPSKRRALFDKLSTIEDDDSMVQQEWELAKRRQPSIENVFRQGKRAYAKLHLAAYAKAIGSSQRRGPTRSVKPSLFYASFLARIAEDPVVISGQFFEDARTRDIVTASKFLETLAGFISNELEDDAMTIRPDEAAEAARTVVDDETVRGPPREDREDRQDREDDRRTTHTARDDDRSLAAGGGGGESVFSSVSRGAKRELETLTIKKQAPQNVQREKEVLSIAKAPGDRQDVPDGQTLAGEWDV